MRAFASAFGRHQSRIISPNSKISIVRRRLELDSNDSARIARALEVVVSTGRTLREWQSQRQGGIGGDVSLSALVLLPPRQWLYDRCEARFERMIGGGALAEVEALLARGLSPDLPALRAIGVREISAFLNGDIDRDEMLRRGKQATRNYAKRQYTWFSRQTPPEWPRWCAPLDEATMAGALVLLGASA